MSNSTIAQAVDVCWLLCLPSNMKRKILLLTFQRNETPFSTTAESFVESFTSKKANSKKADVDITFIKANQLALVQLLRMKMWSKMVFRSSEMSEEEFFFSCLMANTTVNEHLLPARLWISRCFRRKNSRYPLGLLTAAESRDFYESDVVTTIYTHRPYCKSPSIQSTHNYTSY
jgi:hypothetical protein